MTITEALAAALDFHRAGNLQKAEALYRQILAVDPAHPESIHFLGVIAHQVGKQDIAIEYMKKSIELRPLNEMFSCNLGMAYQAAGKLNEAADAYRQALQLRPEYPEALNNLGNVLSDLGKLDEAVLNFERALHMAPNYPDAHSNFGIVLQKLGRIADAEAHCRKAIRLKPDYVEARNNLGNAQREQGKLDEAVINFREALRLRPNFVLAMNNLGGTLHLQGKTEEAIACYRQALQMNPNYPEAHANIATALQALGKLDDAEWHLKQALTFQPNFPNGLNNLGGVMQLQGKLEAAVGHFSEALRLNPADAYAASNLLLCLNYNPKIDDEILFSEHQRWGDRYGRAPSRGPVANHDRNPSRRLRIGYVSPDLSWHPIAWFLQPILANHDANQVEALCYAEITAPDAATERLKALSSEWRVTHGLNDVQVADMIRADGIDILVDLAGHTAKSRLRVFAHKPAPVQATYLGYPNTTGLTTMDYLITDAVADPPGEPAGYTEELIRLPNGFSCYAPPPSAPEVSPSPAGQNGYVTFGSLHNLPRLNDVVLELWCKLLRAVPASRLLVFRHSLQGTIKEGLYQHLLARGIAPERLDLRYSLEGATSHLDVYRLVDISLDTFPWSGHTTACESLWMGVPVVTLRGTRHATRMVSSVLTQVGLTDLIGDTPGQYLEVATRLANDRERLAHLRATLREQMGNSPLCDGKGFTRSLEAAYREMWQRWCGKSES